MKQFMHFLFGFFLLIQPVIASITVQRIKGRAEVRRGVSEEWRTLAVGDVLKPDDTIRTGEEAEVQLKLSETETFTLRAFSMLDCADLRQLSKNDLLIRLAMEHIRTIPDTKVKRPAATTVTHGSDISMQQNAPVEQRESAGEAGTMRLEGAKALFAQRYFSSTVLAVKATLRTFGVRDRYTAHTLAAQAFERLGLAQHAIDEYNSSLAAATDETHRAFATQQVTRLRTAMK